MSVLIRLFSSSASTSCAQSKGAKYTQQTCNNLQNTCRNITAKQAYYCWRQHPRLDQSASWRIRELSSYSRHASSRSLNTCVTVRHRRYSYSNFALFWCITHKSCCRQLLNFSRREWVSSFLTSPGRLQAIYNGPIRETSSLTITLQTGWGTFRPISVTTSPEIAQKGKSLVYNWVG